MASREEEFRERLLDALGKGKSAVQVADELGVSQPSVSRWRRGERTPDVFSLARICERRGISANALLGIPETARDADRTVLPSPPKDGDWELVPRVTEQVAAGEAIYDETAIPERNFYCFRRGYIKHLIGDGMEPGRLVLVPVARGPRGESMMPTIRPGALVMIDRGLGAGGWNEVEHGAIYLVRPEDEGVTLKRVVRAGARALVIFGDNPEQPPRPIEVAKGETMSRYVLGRVRWIGQEVV